MLGQKNNVNEKYQVITMAEMQDINLYLFLSAIMFIIGAAGAIYPQKCYSRLYVYRNNALFFKPAFIVFGRATRTFDGTFMIMFIMTVAAVEAAIGLAIFILMYRKQDPLIWINSIL